MRRREIGKFGEDIACDYLVDKGYKILSRNFFTRYGEIDIVTKLRDSLVFIEVKTRAYFPEQGMREVLPITKIIKLKRAGLAYLASHSHTMQHRWELVLIVINRNTKIIHTMFSDFS